MTKILRWSAAVATAFTTSLMPALNAEQKFIEGIFMETEDGTPVEMIAWAESRRSGVLTMERGSLEDAPIVPRTYRFLMNLGMWRAVNVMVARREVFAKPLDHVETREFPVTRYRVGVDRYEHTVPELENWNNVLRLRKNLKATADDPLIMFLVVSNGNALRLYPFFLDR